MEQTLEERISYLEALVQRQQQQIDRLIEDLKELKVFGSINMFR